jgi:photosystem II stability/assembly factor-like uncharacterized protein
MNMKRKASPIQSSPKDYVYQLATSPEDWYAACASGLYRSLDRGSSWQITYGSLGLQEPLSTLCVAAPIGPEEHSIVFAGLNGGILRSTDNGDTWQSLPLPSPAPIVASLAPSPDFAQDGKLFAGTLGSGVLMYTSYGTELAMWNFGLLDHEILCLAVSPSFVEDRTLYAGAQSGLFMSANGGHSWREVDLPIGYTPVLSLAISPNYQEDGCLYVGTERKGLFHSSDQGGRWQRLGKKELVAPINAILLSPGYTEEGGILVLHSGELLFSPDGGDSWKPWQVDTLVEKEVTAILTPHGHYADQPLLIGYIDGEICLRA